jgi:hypothetical protein
MHGGMDRQGGGASRQRLWSRLAAKLAKRGRARPRWLGVGVAPLTRAVAVDDQLGHGLHLLMIEQAGCFYCQQWDEDVGAGYGNSDEGRFAPLVRQHIRERRGGDIGPVVYTPTFVLVRDGREVGRITGYISADFFWGTLTPLLQEQGFLSTQRAARD